MGENRKHSGGRPKAENPLAVDCKVRLTAADSKRLDRYCKKHDTKRALAIRAAILAMLNADET
jgi:hypothetical protein